MIRISILVNLDISGHFKFIFCNSSYIYISLHVNNHFKDLCKDKELGGTVNALHPHDGTG